VAGAHRSTHRAALWGTKAQRSSAGRESATAVKRIRVRWWCSVWSKRRHGEAKQGAARVVLWCRDAIGVFYSHEEAVEGGGIGRRWIFNSIVLTLNRGEESTRRRASAGG
jgi:hypothetical protein